MTAILLLCTAASCVVQEDAECLKSPVCKAEGRCAVVPDRENDVGTCAAVFDSDCKASAACEKEGRCVVEAGRCVKTGMACRAPRQRMDGACRLPPGFQCEGSKEQPRMSAPWACDTKVGCGSNTLRIVREHSTPVPTRASEADCKAARCGAPFTVCGVTKAWCARWGDCAKEGYCGWGDARFSPKCLGLPGERCDDFFFGVCKKTEKGCQATPRCKLAGMCSAATRSAFCRPTGPAHCKASENCRVRGECSYFVGASADNFCAPETDADCKRSEVCKAEGRCKAVQYTCVEPRAPALRGDP